MDFVRAANRAPEGRSIIALPSTSRDRAPFAHRRAARRRGGDDPAGRRRLRRHRVRHRRTEGPHPRRARPRADRDRRPRLPRRTGARERASGVAGALSAPPRPQAAARPGEHRNDMSREARDWWPGAAAPRQAPAARRRARRSGVAARSPRRTGTPTSPDRAAPGEPGQLALDLGEPGAPCREFFALAQLAPQLSSRRKPGSICPPARTCGTVDPGFRRNDI